jgi:hypothetical protein
VSTYREIVGKKIKKLSSDPTAGADGQMWYNSTTGSLRGLANLSAWSSASPMSTGREFGGSGIGTQGANIVAGGYQYSPDTRIDNTEEYNGNGWTTITTIGEVKYLAGGAGSVTAGLVFGGSTPPYTGNTEEYNGSAWAEQTNMTTARSLYNAGAGGPSGQTAGLAAGGYDGSNSNATEEYDGSSWTNGGNLGTARRASSLFGTQTAATLATGYVTGPVTTVENYDGSAWTTGTSTNVAKNSTGCSAMSQTSAVVFAGNGPGTAVTTNESWDGTSWSVAPTLATGRAGTNGAGTGTAAIAASGLTTPPDASPGITEEFNTSTNVITAAAWATGGALANAKGYRFGGGTQNAAFAASGFPSPFVKTEEYNGSTWSEGGDIGTSRYQGGSAGSQTAGLIFGGYVAPTGTGHTEEYNGSSWSEQNNLNQSRYGYGGLGTQTAALYASAYQGTLQNVTEEYDGSSWTAVSPGTQNQSTLDHGTAGTQTAGLIFGGQGGPGSPLYANAETYNGSTWTAVNTLITARSQLGGSGTQTAAIAFGGRTPSVTAVAETWDGTTWATAPSLATARRQLASTRVETGNTAALAFGGSPVPGTGTLTEEFTGETITGNVKTFSTS